MPADWYLDVGVPTVWIVLPEPAEVLVVHQGGEARFGRGSTLPEPAGLANLRATVDELVLQRLSRSR